MQDTDEEEEDEEGDDVEGGDRGQGGVKKYIAPRHVPTYFDHDDNPGIFWLRIHQNLVLALIS